MNELFITRPQLTPVPVELVPAAGLAAWQERQTPAVRLQAQASGFRAECGQVLPLGAMPGGHNRPPSQAHTAAHAPAAHEEDARPGVAGAGELGRIVLGTGEDDPFALAALPPVLPAGVYVLSTEMTAETAPRHLLAWCLGTYGYDRYKTGVAPRRDWPQLAVPEAQRHATAAARRTSDAVFLIRDLVNTPASDMAPPHLEAAARALAEAQGAHIAVTTGDALLGERFHMIHAVGRASAHAPRLIDLTWGDADAPKLTLVGKGVCFDTGGLNLKPGTSMALMKKDMGGAAHVLGLAQMIMEAGLKVRLRVLVPAVENAIGGNAYRPGDVLKSRKGLTVEIGNTDAEGRLVLADALALADEEAPDLLIDIATLTGAARVALGPDLPPFYTDDEELARAVERAAAAVHDPVWRMPLWKRYLSWLDSPVADVNHFSERPMAGSVTASLFLGRFVERAKSWAHFDIYASNPDPRPGHPKGAAAQAVRAIFRVLAERYG